MLATQAQGGWHEGFGRLGCGRSASVVGRVQCGRARLAEAADQPSDGARLDVEGRGDGGAILAGLKALPDGLTYWHRKGARHGSGSRRGLARGTGLQCTTSPTQRTNFVSQFRGPTSCRVTARLPPIPIKSAYTSSPGRNRG